MSGEWKKHFEQPLSVASFMASVSEVSEQEYVALARQIRLARSVREVPNLAYNRLVEAHLQIVVTLSAQYHSEMYERDDLIQEGSLKLVELVQKYSYQNKSYGHFVAYLKASLRGHLFPLVCSDGYRNVYQSTKYPVYLEPLFDHDKIIALPVQRDESMYAQCVERLLNELPVLQQSVLRLRYGIGCEQVERHKDIARMFGTTEAKVRYAEAKAMIILRSEVVA
jgi:RNA polymerase sigma factor (sigma-70 family)